VRQALYRKYRPRTFDDVCGQEHITSVLRYEVAEGALSHAYLFCGSRGTGKTTCAKILAKAANCLSPVNGSPCCQCEACLSIESGAATDVLEMDAASNNGVESIRDIRDEVVYSPSALKYRVYIVDEVHMLSTSAFNALLKTLEEPPAHVIFILATTELHKLPATIISRCQRFDFRRISVPVLAARISYIAREEGFALESAAAERIAKTAQGGMRDAISLLELCGSAGGNITTDTVNDMMGSGGREGILPVVRAISCANYSELFRIVDEAVASSRDLTVFWQDLISIYRDMLVLRTTDDAVRYLDLTDAELTQLRELVAAFNRPTLLAHCKLLEDAFFAMQNANAVKRMVAELTLVRMCDSALDTSPEGLLARIARLEDAVAGIPMTLPATDRMAPPVAPATPASQPVQAPAAQPAPPPAAPAAKAPAAPAATRTLRRVRAFLACVERIRRENVMLASFLGDAKLYEDEQGQLVCHLPNSFAKDMLCKGNGMELLARAVSAELKRPVDPASITLELVTASNKTSTDRILDDLQDAFEQ
jgi:DNA polymerase-3 subunit gamma/tau